MPRFSVYLTRHVVALQSAMVEVEAPNAAVAADTAKQAASDWRTTRYLDITNYGEDVRELPPIPQLSLPVGE